MTSEAQPKRIMDKFPEGLHVEAAKDMGEKAASTYLSWRDDFPMSTYLDPNDSVRAIQEQLANRDPNAEPPVVSVGYVPHLR